MNLKMFWDEIWEHVVSVVIVFSVVITLISIISYLAFWVASVECSFYSKNTGRETKAFYGVCYVKYQDIWYTREEYSKMLTANMLKE